MKRGTLIVLSGSSGVGKGTMMQEVLAKRPDIHFSVSFTTRSPREGERDGIDYNFISKEAFLSRIEGGEFLEWAEYAGNYYGTSMAVIREHLDKGTDVLLEIEVKGAAAVREKMPEAVSVFVAPPSFEELSRRLVGRGTEEMEKVNRRLAIAREEIGQAVNYDYIVVNDTIPEAVQEFLSILTAEGCRTERRSHIIEEIKKGE